MLKYTSFCCQSLPLAQTFQTTSHLKYLETYIVDYSRNIDTHRNHQPKRKHSENFPRNLPKNHHSQSLLLQFSPDFPHFIIDFSCFPTFFHLFSAPVASTVGQAPAGPGDGGAAAAAGGAAAGGAGHRGDLATDEMKQWIHTLSHYQ